MKHTISVLIKYGTYTKNDIIFFAFSDTEEALNELGYDLIPAFEPEFMTGRYHGAKLSGGVVSYATGNDKAALEGMGYDVLEDKEFIFNHGIHLWMKEFSHKSFAEPNGY